MNKLKLSAISLLGFLTMLLSVVSAKADEYGADAITDLFAGLWNSFWPLVALFFIIFIIMSFFMAPSWLKKIFGAGSK